MADDPVFLDESIFDEKSDWRHKAYGQIDNRSRYTHDVTLGNSYAILPAYITNGYLSCTGIKWGYFNHEEFIIWITERLLPILSDVYGDRPMVVIHAAQKKVAEATPIYISISIFALTGNHTNNCTPQSCC